MPQQPHEVMLWLAIVGTGWLALRWLDRRSSRRLLAEVDTVLEDTRAHADGVSGKLDGVEVLIAWRGSGDEAETALAMRAPEIPLACRLFPADDVALRSGAERSDSANPPPEGQCLVVGAPQAIVERLDHVRLCARVRELGLDAVDVERRHVVARSTGHLREAGLRERLRFLAELRRHIEDACGDAEADAWKDTAADAPGGPFRRELDGWPVSTARAACGLEAAGFRRRVARVRWTVVCLSLFVVGAAFLAAVALLRLGP